MAMAVLTEVGQHLFRHLLIDALKEKVFTAVGFLAGVPVGWQVIANSAAQQCPSGYRYESLTPDWWNATLTCTAVTHVNPGVSLLGPSSSFAALFRSLDPARVFVPPPPSLLHYPVSYLPVAAFVLAGFVGGLVIDAILAARKS